MKKLLLSTTMLFGFMFCANAQNISENALGLRLGSNDGFGSEISYQRKLSSNNRLELDLGWRNGNNVDAIKLTGLYTWVWNIDQGFNWYAGFGGGLGSWNTNVNGYKDNGIFAYAAGDIGIEYNFDFPLQISLDLRPEIGGHGYYENNYGSDIALGLRYEF
ncbi:MAG: hypothetical protein RL308_2163 [Bacteroidota bacterium]|jgi:hypothetical protein